VKVSTCTQNINTNKLKSHLAQKAAETQHLNQLRLAVTLLATNVLLLLTRIVPRNAHATRKSGVVFRSTRDLAGKLLESLTLGLRNEEGGEAAQKHEQGVDLHNVVEPRALVRRCGATGTERADEDLGDDGADFAGGGGDTVGGGTVTCWEALARHDEGG
jgi:uncharacterized membrane protein YgcG